MSSSFGQWVKITTFGESHGIAVGVVLEGIPAGFRIDIEKIQQWLDRRRPGQSSLVSPRAEKDQIEILSGVERGVSLGTPLSLIVRNGDQKKSDYESMQGLFRPSHADFTTFEKYGRTAASGGGRASARETIGRVAAAAVCEQILNVLCPELSVVGFVESVKDIKLRDVSSAWTKADVEKSLVRCPDLELSQKMSALIEATKNAGDSLGGVIRCLIKGCPVGLGEPVFDKLEADLAKAMLSLPASKGFEIGSGFSSTQMLGSQHNDAFYQDGDRIRTRTNHSGGIQGGISNGEVIDFRVAFKPVSTIAQSQKTIDRHGKEVEFEGVGRHDPCVLPRAVPMVEAMALLVLTDHFFRQHIYKNLRGNQYSESL